MKKSLRKTPFLLFPNLEKAFILYTDASFDTVGELLSQEDDTQNWLPMNRTE